MSRAVRLCLVLAVVLCAAAAGFYVSRELAPERVHQRVEALLADVTGAPAEAETVRLVWDFPIRLEGTDVRLYDGALVVESASARLDLLSLLVGRPRLVRLRLDGAELELERTADGSWSPDLFRGSGEPRPAEESEPALAPLRVIERATRGLLSRPLLADTLVLRRSRIHLRHPRPAGAPAGPPVEVVFQDVNGRLAHSRLFGDARLFLRVEVETEGRARGRLEWQGSREPRGPMRSNLAATGLDLSTLTPYLRGARPNARLSGTLDGAIDYQTEEPGLGSLDLDLVVRRLETSLAHPEEPPEPLRVPELTVRMGVELERDEVALSKARVGTGDLDFSLDARIERPLDNASVARVTLELDELVLAAATARKLADWLPETGRQHTISVLERLREGRLVRAEVRGSASVERWRRMVTGGVGRDPTGFALALRFEDVVIDVDASNRLEDLRGEIEYANDTLEISDTSGRLNGGDLPGLAGTFEGVSKVLDSPPSPRERTSSAEALVGLTPLFDFLRREPDPDEPRRDPPSIDLVLDQVQHPALLWPLRDVRVKLVLQPDADGVVMQLERSAWAGVLLDGEVDWTLRPARRLDFRLAASEPAAGEVATAEPPPVAPAPVDGIAAPEPLQHPWVEGRFRIGAMHSPRWSQSGASGRFTAAGGTLRIEEVVIDLLPSGTLAGRADLDLTERDRVPYESVVKLQGGDVKTIIAQRGAEGEFATGTLDAEGELRGNLIPGNGLVHDADGRISMRAADGAIQRRVPPVFALALASTSLNPFSRREELHYERASSELRFEQGRLSTDGLDIEGPDVRLFVSGALDLSHKPYAVDAELVLFLFRQVDRALELIPVVNVLLLGENDNMLAAYFHLSGTWQEPDVQPKPLRTLTEGPGSVITKGIPNVVRRGIGAVGDLFRGRDGNAEPEPEPRDGDAPDAEAQAAP